MRGTDEEQRLKDSPHDASTHAVLDVSPLQKQSVDTVRDGLHILATKHLASETPVNDVVALETVEVGKVTEQISDSDDVLTLHPSSFNGIDPLLGGPSPERTPALSHLTQEEEQRLIDMDQVTRTALERVENSGIIFLDEIDKIAGRESGHGGPDVSREGVQRDILPIVEGTTVSTRYGMLRTDHILFIAAGAFHVSKPSDLIPELQGRFPIRVELQSLTKGDFFRILKEPKNALTKQYEALLKAEEVELPSMTLPWSAWPKSLPKSTPRSRTSGRAACTPL